MPLPSASHVSPVPAHPLAAEYRLLDEWEGRWRPSLNRVSRVFELGDLPPVVTEVTRALGRVFSWDINGGEPVRCHRWPACTVTATVALATESYHEGVFWEELWAATGTPLPHRKDRLWGEEFLRSLGIIGLKDHTPVKKKKYVGTALLHAGLPTHCLDNLFDLVAQWNHQRPQAPPEDLLTWLTSARSRVAELDLPIRLLVGESPAQAAPVLELCARLFRTLADAPGPDPGSDQVPVPDARAEPVGPPEPAGTDLPHRFREPALRAVVRWQNREEPPRSAPKKTGTETGTEHTATAPASSPDPALGLVPALAPARAPAPEPVLTPGAVLPGVTDPWGEPVRVENPRLLLEPTDSAPWTLRVQVRDDASSPPLSQRVITAPGEIDPLSGLAPPRVGSFTLSLQRPGQSTHHWQVAVAEGLEVDHRPTPRMPTASGPEPSVAVVTPPPGFRAATTRLSFSPERDHLPLRLTGPSGAFDIRIEPPRCRTRLSRAGSWSSELRTLAPEELRDVGELQIRCSPADASRTGSAPTDSGAAGTTPTGTALTSDDLTAAVVFLVSPEGDVLQVERPRVRADGTLVLRPSRFTEATRDHPVTWIMLRLGDRVAPVARLRPAPPATGAEFTGDDTIRLEGLREGQNLVAILYQEQAPWRAPLVLPVRDGQVPTEDYFQVGGPVQVLVRVDDPWSAAPPPPPWPDPRRETVLRCVMPGRPNSSDRAEDLLCAHLSGRAGAVPIKHLLDRDNTHRVWAAAASLGPEAPTSTGEPLTPLLNRIAFDPARALTDHTDTELPGFRSLWALIRAGGASVLPSTPVSEERLCALWESDPVSAALLSRSAVRMADSLDTPVARAAISRCGPETAQMLRGVPTPLVPAQNTPHPLPTGRDLHKVFQAGGARWPLLSPAVERRLVSSVEQAVPEQGRPVIGVDAEVIVALSTVLHRSDPRSHKAFTQLLTRRRSLSAASSPSVSTSTSTSASRIPVLSLLLAVNARLAARPGPPAESLHLDRLHRSLWSDLARTHPYLVAFDLVLAELAATGLDRSRLH